MSYETEIFQFVLTDAVFYAHQGKFTTEDYFHTFNAGNDPVKDLKQFRTLFSICAKIIGNVEYDRTVGSWVPTGNDHVTRIVNEVQPMSDVTKAIEAFGKAFSDVSEKVAQDALSQLSKDEIEKMLQKIVKEEFEEKVLPAMTKNLESLMKSTKQELSMSIDEMIAAKLKTLFSNII